jgi:hypothetical protein
MAGGDVQGGRWAWIAAAVVVVLGGVICLYQRDGAGAPESDCFPLSAGNSWTYSKTVPAGKRAFFQRVLALKDGRSFVTTGGSVGFDRAVSCTETYDLVVAHEADAWEVRISAEPTACNSKDGPRDGRYYGAIQVLWQKKRADDLGRQVSGDLEGVYVMERIRYEPERLPPGWREQVTLPAEEARTEAIVWSPGAAGAAYPISVTVTFFVERVKLSAEEVPDSVETPAGRFTGCIEVEEVVAPSPDRDPTTPWAGGWRTVRYYCQGVGLVKEVQSDQAGETLYTLVLTQYHLAIAP